MRFDKEYQRYLRGECKNYNQSLISALGEMEKGGEGKNMIFDEHTEKAREIEMWFERFLGQVELLAGIHYINPKHDIARRFMNEIEEFQPVGEVKI